jgi:hypothetical protein
MELAKLGPGRNQNAITMSTLEKLTFHELTTDGNNYLSWSLDMNAHLAAKDLLETIVTDNGPIVQ